jgi:hypothetical protein
LKVGRYAPIDIQDINISIGKEKLGLQQWLKHLESVSQWKKAVDDLREQEKRGEIPKQYYCRTKT